jgi:tetratricopeptide (TPR) repeat protein
MEYKLLQEKYSRCCQLVTGKQLREAFIVLQELAEESRNGDLLMQVEKHRETYRNILSYSFGNVEDPEKKTVYYRLLRSVIELADEVRESVISSRNLLKYCSIKRDPEKILAVLPEEVKAFMASLNWEQLCDPHPGSDAQEEIKAGVSLKERQQKIISLFNLLWLTDKYRDAEKDMAAQAIQSNILPWWDKCLVISAITLSVQRHFDETKLNLLADAYKKSEEQVWQRALIGLLVSLYQYNQRLFLYPKIKELLENLSASSNIEKHAEAIIIQFIKARDTEKIAERFRDEIIPEMARIQTRIYDKLDMKNLMQDPFSEEKNPDWEHVFHDSPDLLNKLEELSMLQMEGTDVLMSTFSMLKQFGFFNEISNWFLPFHKDSPDLWEALRGNTGSFDINGFADNMEKSSVLCNSDKYSFCLNVNQMPSRERSMMAEMFDMETKAMEEIAHDDEILHKPTSEQVIFTQYIQDMYRFNKLYANKQEFYDIFSTWADFHNTEFFRWLIKDESIVRNIGEFFFEKGYYQDAIEVFLQIDTLTENFELWQKIAYSHQQLRDYQKALEYYLRADLTDIKKSWNIKKIALCYRRLGNYPKALEYYLEAEKMEPENLQVQSNLAHTFFDMKDYENALRVYFKVEYLTPDNYKIQRPIAWCCLMLEKLDTAKKYFEKILTANGNEHDLLNLGHIEWCLGNIQNAIECYRQGILKSKVNLDWFSEEFLADSEILIRYGIDPVDIPLMLDYLKIIMETNNF